MSDLSEINAIIKSRLKTKAPILTMGDQLSSVKFCHTGSLSLDWALGGGFPASSCIVEFFGGEKCGKTTTALSIIAQMQNSGKECAFIDVENTLDRDWASRLHVNLKDLYLYIPGPGESAETVLEVVLILLEQGYFVVLDSVAFLESEQEVKKKLDEKSYGGASGPISTFCKRAPRLLNKFETSILIINQLRDNMSMYGARTRTPGGRALRHASSIRVEFRQGNFISIGSKSDETHIGVEIEFYVVKNKIRTPFRKRHYDLYFSAGINPLTEVIDLSKYFDVVEMRGSYMYYTYKGSEIRIGNGKEDQSRFLAQNQDIFREIHSKIRASIK